MIWELIVKKIINIKVQCDAIIIKFIVAKETKLKKRHIKINENNNDVENIIL